MDNKTFCIGLHYFNFMLIKADFQIKINNPLFCSARNNILKNGHHLMLLL